jgi:REP element-mobilizing transposase RayT
LDENGAMSTYSQVILQIVFATKNRHQHLSQFEADQVSRYVHGIVKSCGQTPLATKCMPDHIHLLLGFKTTMSIADFVVKIKSNSSKWINEQNWLSERFEWQRGYGVFSYSRDRLDVLVHYVLNQEEHHRRKTFREEYLDLLKLHGVDYKVEFLFGQRE